MKKLFFFMFILCPVFLFGQTVRKVGTGQIYADPLSAYQAAAHGDEIVVYPGTYNLLSKPNWEINKKVAFKAADPANKPTLLLAGISFNTVGVSMSDMNMIISNQISIQAPTTLVNNNIESGGRFYQAIYIQNTKFTEKKNIIAYNTIRNFLYWNSAYAIIVQTDSTIIVGNKIENCNYGIRLGNIKNTEILANTFISCTESAIILQGSSDQVIISNNLLKDCKNGISLDWYGGSFQTEISHNVIYGSKAQSIHKGTYASNFNGIIKIFNNIFADNAGAIPANSIFPNIKYSYNNFFQSGTPPTGVENISADPLFVNPQTNDFHLQNGSPCIDKGDPDVLQKDIDGSRADMGLYGGRNTQDNFLQNNSSIRILSFFVTPYIEKGQNGRFEVIIKR